MFTALAAAPPRLEGFEPGRGVRPDVEVTATLADRLAGRDVVLQRALEVLAASPAGRQAP